MDELEDYIFDLNVDDFDGGRCVTYKKFYDFINIFEDACFIYKKEIIKRNLTLESTNYLSYDN